MTNQAQKTNLILLAILGVLGAGAIVKEFVFKDKYETNETVEAATPLFENFKKDEVTTLVIDGPEDKKVELAKDGDHWVVASENNFRADKADVDKVLNGIEKLKRGKEMSTKVDHLDSFNLQKGKGITVSAFGAGGKSGKPIAEFTIGKAGDDYQRSFLKLADANVIRKVEGTTGDFEAGYDNTWRDKSIYDHGGSDKIEAITITGPKGQVALERRKVMGPKEEKKDDAAKGDAAKTDETKTDVAKTDEKKDEGAAAKADGKKPEQEVKETYWELTVPADGRAKKWLADNIATQLDKLDCDSFFTGTEKPSDLGLDPPAYVAKARREGEKDEKEILYIGNPAKDKKYPVKVPGQDPIWWIASWKGDYLTKTGDELLETPPKAPATDDKKGEEKKTGEEPAAGAATPPAGAANGDQPAEKPADATPPAAPADETSKPAGAAKSPATEPAKAPDGGAKPAEGGKSPDGAKPVEDGKSKDGGGH